MAGADSLASAIFVTVKKKYIDIIQNSDMMNMKAFINRGCFL